MISTKQKEVIQIVVKAYNSQENSLGLIIFLYYVSQSYFSNFIVLTLFLNEPTSVVRL